jgi:hypothetical protein
LELSCENVTCQGQTGADLKLKSPPKRATRRLRRRLLLSAAALLPIALLIVWLSVGGIIVSPSRDALIRYLHDPQAAGEMVTNLSAPCAGAPLLLPSSGFVGLLYADPLVPYSLAAPHTGIDIFGVGKPGSVPVLAAYDGYLTRLPEWKSSVIIRVPKDPLDPSRQIWLYYAHMANLDGSQSYVTAAFPPGTYEKPVKQGDLLGHQGLYAGEGRPPIAMHVHFSVVTSDPSGTFRNETRLSNTLDPSTYLGLNVDARRSPTLPVRCQQAD